VWIARAHLALCCVLVTFGFGAVHSGCSKAALPLDPDSGLPDLVESCDSPGDEDGNGVADCMDPVCAHTPACLVTCGDGVKGPGEQCDDGNRSDGDTCESNCTLPVCGNGIKDPGEQCDDGGAASGTCEADCTLPSVPDCSDGRPALAITSPAAGTAVIDGNDISVTIEFCGVTPFGMYISTTEDDVSVEDQLFTSPFTVSMPISARTIGRVSLRAFVTFDAPGGGGLVFARAVPLNVNTNATLESILLSDNDIVLRAGRTRQVEALGVYSDGVRRDITHLPRTKYGLSNGGPQVVATVSASGLVTAVSPGFASVAVLNGLVHTSASVTVRAVICGDGFVDPGEQCDDHNTDNGDGCDSHCQLEP
jgi:cysteine-rich repeat protein